MIWINLHLPEVRLSQQAAHIKPMARRLQCKDPWIVNWYNTTLLEILEQQNIPKCITQLNDTLLRPQDLRRQHQQDLNAIDSVLSQARQGAENLCRKLKCGQVQWCPRITTAINKILFWKAILKRELGGRVGISILRQRAHKAKIDEIPFPQEMSVDSIKDLISRAYKQF